MPRFVSGGSMAFLSCLCIVKINPLNRVSSSYGCDRALLASCQTANTCPNISYLASSVSRVRTTFNDDFDLVWRTRFRYRITMGNNASLSCVGYHRLWSHRAFQAHWTLGVFLAMMGTLGFQGSIKWVHFIFN